MKKALTVIVLAVFLVAGLFAVSNMAGLPRTYDGIQTDPVALLADPASYAQYETQADGAAAVIVAENLAKTHAVNAVTAVVFDFRGYDTMGEAFILVTAISGAMVILRRKSRKEAAADEQQQQ